MPATGTKTKYIGCPLKMYTHLRREENVCVCVVGVGRYHSAFRGKVDLNKIKWKKANLQNLRGNKIESMKRNHFL